MKKQSMIKILLILSLITSGLSKLDYNQARFIVQYEKKLEKCIQDIGYFTCSTLGKNNEIQQTCYNAIRAFDKCIQSQCFDAEYIELKQGSNFDYQKQYIDYAINTSGICQKDPIVVKYANKSQSTKNYIEEKQDCFDKNAIIFNPNKQLTDIDEDLHYCFISHPKCDTKCQGLVNEFDSCIITEEKGFVAYKSFWDLKSTFPEFKKKIFQACSLKMKSQIDFSPQFSHYNHCVLKQLDKSGSNLMKINFIAMLIGFISITIFI